MQRWFNGGDSTGWVETFAGHDTLQHLTSGTHANQYLLTDTLGNLSYFNDFSANWSSVLQGKLSSTVDANGNQTSYTYNSTTGLLTSSTRGSDTLTYSYNGSSQLTNVALSESGLGTVRQVAYAYWPSPADGTPGDLQKVTTEDAAGNPIDTTFYAYYADNDANGSEHSLKYVFGPAAYARAIANGVDPATDTNNADLQTYADKYFTYYTTQTITGSSTMLGQVQSETIAGQGTYTFAYTPGNNSDGYEAWSTKSVETLPDGSTSAVYTNYVGEPIFKVFTDAASLTQYPEFFKYDDQGRLLWTAHSSAFVQYGGVYYYDSYADVIGDSSGVSNYLDQSGGLIEGTDYYTSTTATSSVAGGVAGYVEDTYVRQGEARTAVIQGAKDYIAQTADSSHGGATMYEVANDTVYGTAGGDARVTRNSYVFASGTTELQSETTTNPPITASQNGPASSTSDTANADSTTQVFDAYGRVVWQKDGGGFITYTQYDAATGAVVKHITDVNTADTGDFSGLPSGWSTPAGGGAELITSYAVDSLGRVRKMTDPSGNMTVYAYIDTNHEVRTYSGWNAATNTVTGPVQVQREFRPTTSQTTLYDETLTETPSTTIHLGSDGLPDGGEAIGTIQSLSRDLTNAVGQVTEHDDYFSMSGATYSPTTLYLGTASNNSASGNYHATVYGYDAEGRQNRVKAPTGTINRTVYDSLGREASRWVGTSDGTNPAVWAPNNASGNMTQVEQDAYDNAGAPAEPTVSETTGGSGVATPYTVRITLVDWGGAETPASDAVVYSELNDGDLLTVASPASVSGYQGYNVYVGVNGKAETKQNSSVMPFTQDWTEDQVAGLSTTDAPAPLSGTGDGNLTEATTVTGSSDPDRITQRLYDFRDRLIAEKDGVQASEDTATHRPIYFYQLDNLGEQTGVYQYDGDQIPLSDFANGLPSGDAGRLRAESLTTYDDQGRPYLTQQFSVDPSSGAVSAYALTSRTWYDHRGNVIKTLSPGGLVQKYVYDGAGRQTIQYATDGGGDSSWADAGNVTGDVIVSQVETQYNADGNPTFTTGRERFNTDSDTQTGALGSPLSGIGARVYYSGSYYDALGRLTDSVNFGTNGGTVLSSRPAFTSLPPGALHTNTQYTYSSTGEEDIVTDPRGIQNETFTDLLGRTTKTVTGHTTSGPASIDQTTTYTYNGDNEELSQEAFNGTGHQTTQWVYGPNPTGGYTLHDNDLQVKVEMPDPNTGDASTSGTNDQSYTYDNLGEKLKTLFDENGTTHLYNYDVLGRLTFDNVPIVGTGVDGSVHSIGYTYSTNGQLSTATEYSGNTGSGTLLNQIQEVYNGLGQLIGEYQSHSGAVITGTTPEVQYLYAALTGSSSDGRATGIIYPNDRQLNFVYNSGLDSNISRISALADASGDGAGNIESYSYLGLNTIVQRTRPNNTDLTYIGSSNGPAGDQYVGLDEFGRVIDQNWQTTSTGTAIDRNQYGYDADSNVLYRNNLVNSAESELYHANGSSNGYDALNRLTAFSRGTLNGTDDSITTASHTINWNLDAVGNWSGSNAVTTDGVSQSRTANARNEYTGVGSNTPTYDNNGNLTKDEAGQQYVYDAWNRLKQVKNSSGTVLVTYSYDALGRRIVEAPTTGTTTDLYFNTSGNVIEERQSGATTTQYVWGPGYQNDLVLRDDTGGSGHHYGTASSPLNRRLFVEQDANFNVTSVADASGVVQQRYVYDPYGAKTTLDGGWNAVLPVNDTVHFIYSFQGGRQDPTSGLVHFGMPGRDYSTTLGRWTEADSGGYIDGPNVYQGWGGDPVDRTDPSGLTFVPRLVTRPRQWLHQDHLGHEQNGVFSRNNYLEYQWYGVASDTEIVLRNNTFGILGWGKFADANDLELERTVHVMAFCTNGKITLVGTVQGSLSKRADPISAGIAVEFSRPGDGLLQVDVSYASALHTKGELELGGKIAAQIPGGPSGELSLNWKTTMGSEQFDSGGTSWIFTAVDEA